MTSASERLWRTRPSAGGEPIWQLFERSAAHVGDARTEDEGEGYVLSVLDLATHQVVELKSSVSETAGSVIKRLSERLAKPERMLVLVCKGREVRGAERMGALGVKGEPPALAVAAHTRRLEFDREKRAENVVVSEDGASITTEGSWTNVFTNFVLPTSGTVRWRITFTTFGSFMIGIAMQSAELSSNFHGLQGQAYLYYVNGQATYPNYNSIPLSLNCSAGLVVEVEVNMTAGTMTISSEDASAEVYSSMQTDGDWVPVIETCGQCGATIELC